MLGGERCMCSCLVDPSQYYLLIFIALLNIFFKVELLGVTGFLDLSITWTSIEVSNGGTTPLWLHMSL
jgi:hypothetical protein